VAAWAAVAACGLILLLVPLLKQKRQEPAQAPALETQAPVHGRRLLQAALSDHLERASILFTHVLNDSGFVRAANDEDELDDLIAENRLYRQTAEQQNDQETAALLSDVETVLLDLQHSPAASATELRYVQQRISDSSLRFRLGVARSYQQPAAATHVRLVGRGL
jgi:TPR repeat protein